MATQTSYLERYVAGDHEHVWAELQALGAAVRKEPLYRDALAVAHETMQRVRHNLEILIPRLETIGYSFGYEWWWAEVRLMGSEEYMLAHPQQQPGPLSVIAPPGPDVAAQLVEVEPLCGQIPLSVMAWYKVVGSVNLTGLAPEGWWQSRSELGAAPRRWPPPRKGVSDTERAVRDEQLLDRRDHTYWLDPIEFWPLEEAIRSARFYDALLRDEVGAVDISSWRDHYIPIVPMGPDMHTKFNYSGGGPIGVRASESSMDGLFENDFYQGLFVDYLRLCCRHAGLPGLGDLTTWIRERGVPARMAPIERDLRYLTQDLLPF